MEIEKMKVEKSKVGISLPNGRGTFVVSGVKTNEVEKFEDSLKVAFIGIVKEVKDCPEIEVSGTKRHGFWLRKDAESIGDNTELGRFLKSFNTKNITELKEFPVTYNPDGFIVADF